MKNKDFDIIKTEENGTEKVQIVYKEEKEDNKSSNNKE